MNSKLASRSSKLFIPSQESNFFSKTEEIAPPELSLKPLGKLLIALEIASPSEENKEVGETLIESIKTEYYKDPGKEVLENFENALQKANETLADLTEAGKTSWLGKLHMIVGVLGGDALHLAKTGNAEGYLARGEQIVKISEGLAEAAEEKPQPLKTFENIASGNIEEGDRVIISTPELFYHVSLEELRRETEDTDPTKAAEKIAQKLSGEEGIGNLAALITEVATEDKLSEEPVVVPNLPEKSETVEEVKEDAKGFAEKTKNMFQGATKTLKDTFQKEKPQEPEKPSPTAEITPPPSTTAKATASQPEAPKQSFLISLKKFFSRINGFLNKLKSSSLNRNRLLLGAITILILVFLIGGTILIISNSKENSETLYRNKLTEAQSKQKEAEDALIYNNEVRARQLLVEASSLVDEILASKYFKSEAESLHTKIQTTLDKINRITRIDDAKTIADFSTTTGTDKLDTILELGKYLYLFNPDSSAIFDVSLEKPKAEIAAEASASVSSLEYGTVMKDQGILIFYNEKGIYEFDPEKGELEQKEIETGETTSKAIAIGTYFSNLYLLSASENQIYKHIRTISGYGKGSEYLTDDSVNLSDAISMAIDGYVYVLKRNGEIIKLLKGNQTDFEVNGLPDPLKNPALIFINPDTKYLYVFDKGNSRIIALDEKGKFAAQYVTENLNNATGFTIDEQSKKGYFLSEKKIYQFNLKHF